MPPRQLQPTVKIAGAPGPSSSPSMAEMFFKLDGKLVSGPTVTLAAHASPPPQKSLPNGTFSGHQPKSEALVSRMPSGVVSASKNLVGPPAGSLQFSQQP